MSKKKLSAKEVFLNAFEGHYKKELPQDDFSMFVELCGLYVARETFELSDKITELTFSADEAKTKKSIARLRNSFLKNCYNAFIAYICEEKGYTAKGISKEYRNWYIEMSGKYEQNKETWEAKIAEMATYFSDITRVYLFSKVLSMN